MATMAKPKPSGSVEVLPDSSSHVIPKLHTPNLAQVDEDYLPGPLFGRHFADQLHGDTKDLFYDDLIAPFKDIQTRLQKVEEINNRLKRERLELMTQVNSQKKEIVQLKKANKHLLESKSDSDEQVQQLSITLQENTCLKEVTAKINIENIQLTQELKSMEVEMNKMKNKIMQLQDQLKQHGAGDRTSDILRDMQLALSKRQPGRELQGNSEKRRSAQLLSTLNLASQLLSQFDEEKKELELQCQQMGDLQKAAEAIPPCSTPSDYSLLGFETSETDDIKAAGECLQNLMTTKQDLTFINFNLKYLLHLLLSRKQDEGFSSSLNLRAASEDDQSDIVADGIGHNVSEFKPTPSCRMVVDSRQDCEMERVGKPPERSLAKASRCSVPASPFDANPNDKKLPSSLLHSKWSGQPGCFSSPSQPSELFHRRTPKLPHSNAKDSGRNDSAKRNVTSAIQLPVVISPDSLSMEGRAELAPAKQSDRMPKAVDNEDDRICPMCQTQFPKCVDLKDFEAHVVGHFDVEEFELI